MRRHFMLAALLALGACGADDLPPPPAYLAFQSLPVRGSVGQARAAGFAHCVELGHNLRCRRDGVTLYGVAPLGAAVDLRGSEGQGGFHELTLWHDRDQYALYKVRDVLRAQGWQSCITGDGRKGDQMIFTRVGAPVRFSMDISYWGKRRMRIVPEAGGPGPACG